MRYDRNSIRTGGWPVIAVLLLALGASGCERKMLDFVCTPVSPGQLVITEIRGEQADTDTWGQWIEIHNRGNTAVDVTGIRIRLLQLDGTNEVWITVRAPDMTIAAGGYFVVGRFPANNLPDHVDYGYETDFTSDLYADGLIELYVCNELEDSVLYHNLPTTGSLSFDGDLEPTVEANDIEANWCNDASDVGGNPTEVGIPGTPGEQNRPCN